MPEIALGTYGFAGGDAEIEYQQRHGDGKDSVAEGGEALDALPGNAVVGRVHQMEFSGLPRGRQSGRQQLWNAACGEVAEFGEG